MVPLTSQNYEEYNKDKKEFIFEENNNLIFSVEAQPSLVYGLLFGKCCGNYFLESMTYTLVINNNGQLTSNSSEPNSRR